MKRGKSVNTVCFGPDGKYLAMGGDDNKVFILSLGPRYNSVPFVPLGILLLTLKLEMAEIGQVLILQFA